MFVFECDCGHRSEHATVPEAVEQRALHSFEERECDCDSWIDEEPGAAAE